MAEIRHECTVGIRRVRFVNHHIGEYVEDVTFVSVLQCALQSISENRTLKDLIEDKMEFTKFKYCPFCGKAIDWDEVLRTGEDIIKREEENIHRERKKQEDDGLPF